MEALDMDGHDAFDAGFDFSIPDEDLRQILELSAPDFDEQLIPPLPPDSVTALEPGIARQCPPVSEFNGNVLPLPLDCSRCHILREVVHINGEKSMKLEIHGGMDEFYHARLDVYHNVQGFLQPMQLSYFDFRNQGFEEVKQFLTDYGRLRLLDQYIVVQDSLSGFHDALCVKMNDDSANASIDIPCLPEQGLSQSKPTPGKGSSDPNQVPKTGIAAQRERTGKLHLRDLAGVFHLPIVEASKEFGLCPTAIKKICRKYGMSRWPYRKVKSVDRIMLKLQQELRSKTGLERVSTLAEIEKLRRKRSQICAGQLS